MTLDRRQTTIFVTGGTGFLGSYLLRYLWALGHRNIRALRRADSRMDLIDPELAAGITWITGDLFDRDALVAGMSGADQVYHCAAVVSFDSRDARSMQIVNVGGTTNLVDVALEVGIGKLLHVSSIAALGRQRPGETLSEANIWQRSRFSTRYGLSKFMAELEVWRGVAEGLSAVVINPSIILGSGRWNEGAARFFSMVGGGFPFFPRGTGSFVDVRDVVRMMVQLMEEPIEGERFIASAGEMSFQAFFQQIAREMGCKAPRWGAPAWFSGVLWPFTTLYARLRGKSAFITRETARQSAVDFHYDASKSREELHFQYLPLSETIRDTARDWLTHQSDANQLLPTLPFTSLP
ncbi:MAG: NAD-dependent epimerase/dehydratase family protein [Lewinellaceae bacterium]|nr:NAD-dependent epimerase/dehydratase family protein [Lewinellaceae bacterium]